MSLSGRMIVERSNRVAELDRQIAEAQREMAESKAGGLDARAVEQRLNRLIHQRLDELLARVR